MRSALGFSHLPLVIYESTVYPGATEEVCVPILERESDLAFNQGFVCGYSPERINPGDNEHRLTTITKVTSGSTQEASAWLMPSMVDHQSRHPSRTQLEGGGGCEGDRKHQRDLNIALVNELAIIFSEMHIDTLDVLEAAGTKWNFLPFRPGLVEVTALGRSLLPHA